MNSLTSMYIDGGDFMHPILLVFILGLIFSFERLYTLRKSKIKIVTPPIIPAEPSATPSKLL